MTLSVWLEAAVADADRRGLPALRPLLQGLARSTTLLRTADWNTSPAPSAPSAPNPVPSRPDAR